LLIIALSEEDSLKIMAEKYALSADKFISKEAKRLFGILFDLDNNKDIINSILADEELSLQDKDIFAGLAITDEKPSLNWPKFGKDVPKRDLERVIRDVLTKLEIIDLNQRIQDIKNSLKTNLVQEQLIEQLKLLDLLNRRKDTIRTDLGSNL
jgi:hypothetical protein